jgi:hypothetical protein
MATCSFHTITIAFTIAYRSDRRRFTTTLHTVAIQTLQRRLHAASYPALDGRRSPPKGKW